MRRRSVVAHVQQTNSSEPRKSRHTRRLRSSTRSADYTCKFEHQLFGKNTLLHRFVLVWRCRACYLGCVKEFVVFYEFVDDYLQRRGEHRAGHGAVVSKAIEQGHLRLAGPYSDTADGCMIIFRAHDRSVPEAFAKSDPYVTHGIVKSWKIREWRPVTGVDLVSYAGEHVCDALCSLESHA